MKSDKDLSLENSELSRKLAGVLDELCDFKSALDGMMMSGMSTKQIVQHLEKQVSFYV